MKSSLDWQPYGRSFLIGGILFTTLFLGVFSESLKAHTTANQLPGPITTWPRELDALYTVTSPICTTPVRGNCAFYADCLESRYQCGPEGYPIGYGQHYCEEFEAHRAELSVRGQDWMLDTMLCLQRQLVPEASDTSTGVTCASLKKKAFGTHAGCYISSGLCTLPPSDWLAIVRIVELKTLFESKEAFLATLSAEEGCLKAYVFFIANWIF